MQKHTKIYLKYFNYGEQDYIPSELSGLPCSDIHHIKYKSQIGKDDIGNLIGLNREEHEKAHKKILTEDFLFDAHNKFLNRHKML